MYMTSAFITGLILACLSYDYETLSNEQPVNCKKILETKLVKYQRDSVKARMALLCACVCIGFMLVGFVFAFGSKALGK